ncbi:restriction endonuclease subunit S [Roseibacterium beibuensis]|uniref:restriction endonuclease subunit S n=1 Tax=[Roseibacterium] beibuensis TaxID=1193142 RepID=UPI00217E08A9|nr:restriction endonuclease subunit S [Roseibacterium beibuensis]MCS6627914.1 restriction endonuclease subunit S [Roseibacterium beibuensis]
MSSEAPECWSVKPLGEIADLIMGQSPPSSAVKESGDGLPFIQGNAEFGARHPKPRFVASHAPKVVQTGDILVSVRAPVGEVNIAEGPLCIGRGVGGIRAKKCDPDFLFYAVGGLSRVFSRLSQGSTFDAINGKELRTIEIPIPPLDEQRRIAEVLRSVDEAVANELALLGQYQSAYNSTMSAFLATGNDADDGRPTDEWITGRIKAVRRIPKDWRITRLVEVAKLESGHTPSRTVEAYWKGGDIGWISLHDTKNLERREVQETTLKITAAGVANSSARMLPQGTVCLSRTATVGKCVIMGKPMTTSQDFANFVCSPALNNRYLLHLFRWMAPIWKALSSGSTHKTIYMPTFEALQIVVPPIEAQESVAGALDAIASAIEISSEHLEALRELRRSISSDLLSGRVRVPA